MTHKLTLNEYQKAAAKADKTANKSGVLDITILGLVGETGSLLSEVKKKQRDFISNAAYKARVIEELGDCLWYLSTIARHANLTMAQVNSAIGILPSDPLPQTAHDTAIIELQPQFELPMYAPTVAFERTLLELCAAVGNVAGQRASGQRNKEILQRELGTVFRLLKEAANEAGVTLDEAASLNLQKTEDRWPDIKTYPDLFDLVGFEPEEQLPRILEIEIFEKAVGDKTYVLQKCNDLFIGDRLTDNIVVKDDYRFHDVFHYAYAASLGWSPVLRSLLRLKRKSKPEIDEGQDGARAALIEEGIAAYVFGVAKDLQFFQDQKANDLSFSFLKSIRQFVKGYESEKCPLWLWEEAILSGFEAFRFLSEHRRGLVRMDLNSRKLTIRELPHVA